MNILLVEPNYKNKYPPMGLMKISTYHKSKNDTVWYFKGKMPDSQWNNLQVDRVYITTLFTFSYRKSVETIKYYLRRFEADKIYIGGIRKFLFDSSCCLVWINATLSKGKNSCFLKS